MTDPAAPPPGGTTPPAQGQTPYPAPGPYPPPAPGSAPPSPSGSVPPAPGGVPPTPPPGSAPAPGSAPPAPPAGSVPPPPYGAPPPAAPPKKRSPLKIVLIVLAVIVGLCLVCGIAGVVLFRNFMDRYGYKVGNCLDRMPTAEVQTTYYGGVVPCDSPEAEARIVKVDRVDDVDAALADAATFCADAPGYVAAVAIPTGSTGLLLCLAEP